MSAGSHSVSAQALDSVGATTNLIGTATSSGVRHTSWPRDWSSDVCSSDRDSLTSSTTITNSLVVSGWAADTEDGAPVKQVKVLVRSEERRVGKEGRIRCEVEDYINRSSWTNRGWTFTIP